MSYEQLLAELTAAGSLADRWRQVFEAVPRHLFIPAVALADEGAKLVPIHRHRDPDAWLAAVNSDRIIVTQMDDGTVPAAEVGRSPTSSCSMPTMVAEMLAACDIHDGHRVLEVGTGSGWNAALLARRLGGDRVTSVEIDPQVAEQARKALVSAGLHPEVVVGDGEQGWPPGARYDRILATCSVHHVPYPWVEQTSACGRIVTPWRDPFCHQGKLLALDVAGDGTASGQFVGWASFMMSRPQRFPVEDVPRDDGEQTATYLRPGLPLDGDDAETAVGARLRSCQWWREDSDDGYVVRMDDVASRSWAVLGPITQDSGPYPLAQGGPRRLWDEVEAAYRWWVGTSRPDHTRFGVSVTAERQWVWLDEPGQPVSAAGSGESGQH